MTSAPRTMPAMVTPFHEDGSVDVDAFARLVSSLATGGCRGFLIAGSTGEGPYLEPGERRTLVAAARQASPTSFLLCGVNGESLRQARSQIEEASDAGADAALVITPTTLVRENEGAIAAFYLALADWSPIPIWLYSVPKVTAYSLPISVVATVAGHTNISGIKDSSGVLERISDLSSIEPRLLVYCGASRIVAAAVDAGADGAITASANYLFGEVDAAVAGDDAAQGTVRDITAVVESHGVPGTKAATALTGRSAGHPRPPLRDLDPTETDVIRDVLALHRG